MADRKTWRVGDFVFHLNRTGAMTIHRDDESFVLASAPSTLEVLADEMRGVARDWRAIRKAEDSEVEGG